LGCKITPIFTPMKITIENHDDRLRLRWLHQGKRYTMSCGVSDNPTGRAIAKQKAAQIELDVQAGYFDPTLLKYKPRTIGKTATEITAPELFKRFTAYQFKEKGLAPGSRRRYEPIQSYLDQWLNVPAHAVSNAIAGNFVGICLERLTAKTAKERVWLLKSCWDWAIGKYHLADENPRSSHIARIKPHSTAQVKPFAATEIAAILCAFETHSSYKHYYPFVAFLFGTGCRLGEAAGLRWANVADDFSHVTICESFSRGNYRKTTKTGKSRIVLLNQGTIALLKALHIARSGHDSLVFTSPHGKPIDDHNFNRRAWNAIVTQLGIEYRKPYAVRHSAISHALANGANPIALAEQTGHDKRVMLETYAHAIERQSLFVEF
jgi:integrase